MPWKVAGLVVGFTGILVKPLRAVVDEGVPPWTKAVRCGAEAASLDPIETLETRTVWETTAIVDAVPTEMVPLTIAGLIRPLAVVVQGAVTRMVTVGSIEAGTSVVSPLELKVSEDLYIESVEVSSNDQLLYFDVWDGLTGHQR